MASLFCIQFLISTVYYYIEDKLNKNIFGGTYYEYEQIQTDDLGLYKLRGG